MGKLSSEQVNRLVLCIEAVLIIITIATGGKALVGMICYWSLVAFYHLTDFIFEKWGKNDGDK